MRIREVIFQGVWGCQSPVRLAAAPDFDRMNLPDDLSVEQVHDLLLALFFPERISEQLQAEFEGNDGVKLAVVFEAGDRVFRLLRKKQRSSLRLQVEYEGQFKTKTKGYGGTIEWLQQTLGLPEFVTFASLNLWRFDDELFECTAVASAEKGRDLIEKYRVAVRAEELEDRIQTLEQDLAEKKEALGKGAEIEEKLQKARAKIEDIALSDLSEEDLAVLEQKEERFEEFEQKLDRLERQEQEERRGVEQKLPGRPWKQPLFWAGLAIGLCALSVSVAFPESLRQVAAVNVVGFGLIAWVLLRYFNALERASVHQVRLTSIKRRLNQVREQQVSFREKINHLLIHAGVDEEHQLYERLEKSQKLEQIIGKLEHKAAQIREDPTYREAKTEVSRMRSKLERLREERAELPEFVMSAFQLEEDLESLGYDPRQVLEEQDDDGSDSPETTFERLKYSAECTGLWSETGLSSRVRKMWGKICRHLLGERFGGVELTAEGELEVGEFSLEQLEMWRRTRSSEERIVAAALALSLHVNAGGSSGEHIESVWVRDPRREFGSKVADAFDDVFGSAAKKSHIVLCDG